MGRSKISAVLGGALLVAPASVAFAADMPSVPPPPIPIGGEWYLRGDIGMTNQSVNSLYNVLYDNPDLTSLEHVSKEFDSSPFFGLGIGYKFNDHFRMDVTGEYRGGATFHGLDIYTDPNATPTTGTDEYTAKKSEWTFLANAYWDIGTWRGITPFVGAGIGASYNTISGFTDVNTPAAGLAYGATASQLSFAWALYAGLGYRVTPNLSIEAAYRYISLGNAHSGDLISYDNTNAVYNPMEFRGLTSQDFKVGFRWYFDAPKQQSYYPPVVKY
jgi:opacity protein-like surface antigen